MTIHFVTLALDAMPWITWHFPVFQVLPVNWTWNVIEGVSAPENCTSWCKPLEPRLSEDGTTEYLDALTGLDSRVRLFRGELWHGKVDMFNAPLPFCYEPGLVWQLDSDELWTQEQIMSVVRLFGEHSEKNCAYFYCRYFLGPNIVITSRDTYGNNTGYEWRRVWRYQHGMMLESFERGGTMFKDVVDEPIRHRETEEAGCVFDHMAYATQAQVAFKEQFYGYEGAVEQWRGLQRNSQWPARVGDFLKWVKDEAVADRITT